LKERQSSALEPDEHGMLDVGDGNQIYWECWGNRNGIPVLYLHGGPGSGCTPAARGFFDPQVHRVVFFDQRGCGRSRPVASELHADLRTNTTDHLVRDIEQLRNAVKIERWTLLGASWGTTLALAYAQAHPERVLALVLALVTTTSRREVRWITEDVRRIFPAAWERFADAVPQRFKDRPIVQAYAEMLFDADADVRRIAASEWCAWEDAHVSLAPAFKPNPRFESAEFRLGFARLVTHYWANAAFLEDDQLIRDAFILDGIPGELIHGRYDVSTPLETAWRLSKNWQSSTLRIVDDGHGGGQSFVSVVREALERTTAAFLSN